MMLIKPEMVVCWLLLLMQTHILEPQVKIEVEQGEKKKFLLRSLLWKWNYQEEKTHRNFSVFGVYEMLPLESGFVMTIKQSAS